MSIDTATGRRAGAPVAGSREILVGYLVTLPDGFECRMGPDQARAQNYAVNQRARMIEPMYVWRTFTEPK